MNVAAVKERIASDLTWQGFDLTVGSALDDLRAEWKTLEAQGTASLFQSLAYVDAWSREAAAAEDEQPLFVAGRKNGVLLFVLPLAMARRNGATTITWLAQSHANYGMAVIDADTIGTIDGDGAEQLMKQIARHCGADVVHLDNQPVRWAGRSNPFALGRSARLSANDTFVTALEDDFEKQYHTLFSNKALSGLKRKQRKLEDTGVKVTFESCSNEADRLAVIEWFLAKKRAQLAEGGQDSVFDRPAIAELYRSLARQLPEFEIDRMAVDGETVAIALTIRSGTTAYLMNTAYNNADFGRYSPGALLLHRLVAAMHAKGIRTFDFGPGGVRYKFEWEPEAIPLVATTLAVSAVGRPVQLLLALGVATKCAIKRNDRLREMAFAMLRWRAAFLTRQG